MSGAAGEIFEDEVETAPEGQDAADGNDEVDGILPRKSFSREICLDAERLILSSEQNHFNPGYHGC